jgi:ankyrin repeat protein
MAGMAAEINAKGLDNWNALHFAVNSGHEHITKELLSIPGI